MLDRPTAGNQYVGWAEQREAQHKKRTIARDSKQPVQLRVGLRRLSPTFKAAIILLDASEELLYQISVAAMLQW
jgi:hypothetical protein